MIDIAIDQETNDLFFDNLDFSLFDNTKQIMQNLYIRLKFVFGEWFLDITQGVPYYEVFFIKSPNQIQIDSVIKDEIINTRGIVEITHYEATFDKKNRKYIVKFNAKTISGEEFLKELELPV